MNKQFWTRARVHVALAWASCMVAGLASTACSGDDSDARETAPGAGGSGGSGDDAGQLPEDDGGAGGSDPSRYALFVASNFADEAELAVVDLAAKSIAGNVAFDDQDTIPYASGGRGFALHRTLGEVSVLDAKAPWKVAHSIDVKADGASTNPYAAVVTADEEAYVVRYAHNALDIVDLETGAVKGQIDLSSFLHPDDPDGHVDAFDGVYDAKSQRAYFLLGRIDQFDFSGPAPDYVSKCLPFGAAIVGVDVKTHEIVDLNGDAPGQAIELLGQNPSALAADFASDELIVLHAGCHVPAEEGEAARDKRGIEAVSLTSGSSRFLFQTTELDRLSFLLWLDSKRAYVGKGFPTQWVTFDIGEETLGDVEPRIPELPVWDGERIVGLASADDGTTNVVAFDPVSKEVSPIASNIFATSGLYTYGSAVIR